MTNNNKKDDSSSVSLAGPTVTAVEKPIDKKLIIDFDEYLKTYLNIRTKEEFKTIVSIVKSKCVNEFPDLFKPHLDKEQKQDIVTETDLLAQTNNIHSTLLKFVMLTQSKKSSDSSSEQKDTKLV